MAVVTVALSELDAWLQAQPENTVDTPYELNITGIELGNKDNLRTILNNNITKYVDLSSTVIPFGFADALFYNCINLIGAPIIYLSSFEDIHTSAAMYCFKGCLNLKKASIYSGLPTYKSSYSNSDFPDPNNEMNQFAYMFEDCPLETIITDNLIYLKAWLNLRFEYLGLSNVDIEYTGFSRTLMYISVIPFNKLNDYLNVLPANTTSTPYQIKVTEVTANDLGEYSSNGTFGYILRHNEDKYVDLSSTDLSDINITSMNHTFALCDSMIKAPVLPRTVIDLDSCFAESDNLVIAPIIPEGVTNILRIFAFDYALVEVPYIPSTVTYMNAAFDECHSLQKIGIADLSNIDYNRPYPVAYSFSNCNALTTFMSDRPFELYNSLVKIRNANPPRFDGDTWNLPKVPSQYNYEFLNTPAEIPVSLLNNELSIIKANTTSTPYQIKVTELTAGSLGSSENPGTLGYILKANSSKYVNLSSTELPSDITSLYRTFKSCSSMIKCPKLPNVGENTIITTAQECFSGCVNLTGDFPSYWNIDNMASCFQNCASLTDTGITKIESNNFSNCFYDDTALSKPPAELVCKTTGSFEKCFFNCQNMRGMPAFTMFKSGCDYNNCFSYCNYAFSGRTEGNYFPIVINGTGMNLSYLFKGMDLDHSPKITINPGLELETVSNSDYNDLSYMFANCTSFGGLKLDVNYCNIDNICSNVNSSLSFELNVKTRNCKSATNAFLNRKLSSVTADIETDDATAMFKNCTFNQNKINGSIKSEVVASIFENCSTLRDYPTIINPVNMSSAFKGCSMLAVTSLSIPDTVTNIQEAFVGCSSITSVDKILIQITSAKEAFKDCTSLTTIEDFRIPIKRLDSANFQDMFSGCTVLSTIKVPYKAPVETQDWHLYLLDIGSSSVAGKVYDKEGTAVTVQSTSIGKDKLKLPIYTDELMFTNQMSMADLETLAGKILQYKYGVYNRTTLEPDKKNFVLYADNEENVITNLPFVKKSEVVNTVESGNLHSVSSNAVAESLKGKLNNTLTDIGPSEIDNLSGSEISVHRIRNYDIGWAAKDGFIIHIPWSNEFARQIALDDQADFVAIRYKASGQWFSWKQIFLGRSTDGITGFSATPDSGYGYSWSSAFIENTNYYCSGLYVFQLSVVNVSGGNIGSTATNRIGQCNLRPIQNCFAIGLDYLTGRAVRMQIDTNGYIYLMESIGVTPGNNQLKCVFTIML